MVHIQKNRIKMCFNNAWNTYDAYCSVQKTVCEKAVEILNRYRHQYKNVADIACGTGVSTQCLSERIDFNTLYGIDFSEKLLAIAKEKILRKPVEWITADFDDSVFEANSLELVFCNMGLQWSLNLKKTLALFYEYLQCSGVIAFTIPLEGTFPEIRETHKNIFHSKQAVETILKACGFSEMCFQEEYLVESFDSQVDAINSIKSIGANCLMTNKNIRGRKFSEKAIFVNDNIRSLTYKVGIFLAIKKSDQL